MDNYSIIIVERGFRIRGIQLVRIVHCCGGSQAIVCVVCISFVSVDQKQLSQFGHVFKTHADLLESVSKVLGRLVLGLPQ